MARIEWDNSLSVGVFTFDNEHKHLINLINNLHDAMVNGKSREILASTLDELIKYTATHFKHEEELMIQHKFLGYLGHKQEHRKFVEQVLDTQKKFEDGQLMLGLPLLNFLCDWVKNHIQKTDVKYAELFNKVKV